VLRPVPWVEAPAPAAARELERAGHSPRLAHLLARRGVARPDEAAAFLSPAPRQLHPAEALCDLPEAVERLAAASSRHERVAVVGDYDVDGVAATALLAAVFKRCELEAITILPHRFRDGYGFQPSQVERAAAGGCALIVTVDCGIGATAAVAAARARGIDVIVTDHHLPGDEELPGAWVINPRQSRCSYPFPHLTGAGLALKLGLALAARLERSIDLEALLRIACLGTVADVAPLVGENRVITALGLAALANTRSVGLQALFQQARLDPPFAAADIAFRIAPRLNAAGRLDSAELALELLLTRDAERGRDLAARLEALNRQRQALEQQVVDEARTAHSAAGDDAPLLVVWRPGWHRGVVGIAAGRLARELGKPVILLAAEGATATGSGRSLPGADLHALLSPWKRELLRFGGHAQAIGVSAEVAKLSQLASAWAAAASGLDLGSTERREYELGLAPEALDACLVEELADLQPHGEGNPQPLLRVGPLRAIAPPRAFGKGHLEVRARGSDRALPELRLIGWRWAAERGAELAGEFEILAQIEAARPGDPVTLRLVEARPLQGSRHVVESSR